ncbi:MAG: site-2 protease family protein, partial [Rhodothermales bacterium]
MEPTPFLSRLSGASNGRPASVYPPSRVVRDQYWLHLLLFAVTLISTAFTGSQFIGRTIAWEQGEVFFYLLGFPVTWPFLRDGFTFALSLLGFLTVHEFGHYFAARYHRVKTSLPYFIPSPLIGIGTLGAVIRIREQVPSLRKLFDIGAAGPLAGFVVALGVLVYALATLPPPAEFIQSVGGHEALKAFIDQNGRFPDEMLPGPPESEGFRLVVGNTPLYWGLSQLFANVPPMYEMYHHPMLFAGWLGLFFTALNLMPVGQLDGGHILYALVGPKWHARLARGFMILMAISMAIGLIDSGVEFLISVRPSLESYRGALLIGQWFALAGFLYLILNRVFSRNLRLIVPLLFGIVLIAALAKAAG